MLGRETPWNPSQPATTSHASSCSSPSWRVADRGPLAVEVVERDVGDSEPKRPAALEPRGDQVLDDLRLPVHDDGLARQLVEREPVPLRSRLQLDARVDEPLAAHPRPHAGAVEELGDVVLEHACPESRLDVVAAARLEDHRVDPLPVQQMPERQPRRAGTDDPDLGAGHAAERSKSAACPCHTPTHIVARPYRPPRRRSSWSSATTSRAPLIPRDGRSPSRRR